MRIRVSKGFLAAGWLPAAGFALKSAGSALAIFMGDPRKSGAALRIRIGARLTVVERRIHATPTGRCSAGSWERVYECRTPQNARAWTGLGRAALVEAGNADSHTPRLDPRVGCLNTLHTTVNRNPRHPTLGGGKVTRGMAAMPNQTLTWGWAPARGNKTATHPPKLSS
jgi:hypothetical protein